MVFKKNTRGKTTAKVSGESCAGEPVSKKVKICKLKEDHVKPPSYRDHIVKYYETMQRGWDKPRQRLSVKLSLIDHIKTFRVYKAEAIFDRRVTFIEWNQNNPTLLAVASKGGDIFLWNSEQPIDLACMVNGIGAGGSVQAMKFDIKVPTNIYTVTVEGKFMLLNFLKKKGEEFLNTGDNYKTWFVSLDINWGSKTMVVGDNRGFLTMLTTEGEVVSKVQVHKSTSRITHAEFSKREPWLLCTTSNDRYIKLWDIRQFKTGNQGLATPIHSIEHKKPLNAAYFSLTDGCRLLTTDQFDKIYVYRSPLWNLETEINHPHRQYQHLTPIRADWHPLEDIILIGRYPHVDFPGYEEGELRTIDFFDADTGNLLHQHSESGYNGIAALNKFNITGDRLASGSGTRIIIWKPQIQNGCFSDSKPNPSTDVPDPSSSRTTRKKTTKSSKSVKLKLKD